MLCASEKQMIENQLNLIKLDGIHETQKLSASFFTFEHRLCNGAANVPNDGAHTTLKKVMSLLSRFYPRKDIVVKIEGRQMNRVLENEFARIDDCHHQLVNVNVLCTYVFEISIAGETIDNELLKFTVVVKA